MGLFFALLVCVADSILLSSQMEQIKRANRMYTNDSIHLKKSLSIPVLLDCSSGVELLADDSGDNEAAGNGRSDRKQDDSGGTAEELSPEDFLKRLDSLIHQSKQAAVRDAEKRLVVRVCGQLLLTSHLNCDSTFVCFLPAGLLL